MAGAVCCTQFAEGFCAAQNVLAIEQEHLAVQCVAAAAGLNIRSAAYARDIATVVVSYARLHFADRCLA